MRNHKNTIILFILLPLVLGVNLINAGATIENPLPESDTKQTLDTNGTIISAAAYEGISETGESIVTPSNTTFSSLIYFPYITKGGYETTIIIQNIGSSPTEQLELWFYNSANASTPTVIPRSNISSGGSSSTFIGILGDIDTGFQGSVIAVSDQPLAGVALVNAQYDEDSDKMMMYRAVASGNETVNIPRVSRNTDSWTTTIATQNVGSSSTVISIEFVSSTGTSTHFIAEEVEAGAMFLVDTEVVSQLGDEFNGWALISSDGGSIAAVAVEEEPNKDLGAAFNSIPAGSQLLLSPRQQKEVNGWYSDAILINNTGSDVDFTMNYVDQSGATVWTDDSTVGSEVIKYDTVDLSMLPLGFHGGLKVTADQPILGLASWMKPEQTVGDTYAAAGLIGGTSSMLFFPYVQHSESSLVSSEFNIQNNGSEISQISLQFIDNNGNLVLSIVEDIPHNASKHFDTTGISSMVSEFDGSVIVDAASGDLLAGYVTIIKRTLDPILDEWFFLPVVHKASSENDCDPAYPTVCIPPQPPDLDREDIPHRNFTVLPPDPHGFDGDGDGIGCEM